MGSLDAWTQASFDDADDQMAAELGLGLLGKTSRLVMSGDPAQILDEPTRDEGIAAAMWDLSDEEAVEQAHGLFHDAGANVSLTNTWECGPLSLARLHVDTSCEQVCTRAVRAALTCAPLAVAGLVGFGDKVEEADAPREAELSAEALLSQGVHALVLDGLFSERRAMSVAAGVAKANGRMAVPRPVIAMLDSSLAESATEPFVEALVAQAGGTLACLGVSGVSIDDASSARSLVDCVSKLADEAGLAFGVWFCSGDYREMNLASMAHYAADKGALFMRAGAGIPMAGTALLAESLGL